MASLSVVCQTLWKIVETSFFATYRGFSTFVWLLSEIINKVVVAPYYFITTLPQFWYIISQNFFHLSLMMQLVCLEQYLTIQKNYQTSESMHISIYLWAYLFWRIYFYPTKYTSLYISLSCTYLPLAFLETSDNMLCKEIFCTYMFQAILESSDDLLCKGGYWTALLLSEGK